MHEAYSNLLFNTDRVYSLSLRPPDSVLTLATVYAKKLNVFIDATTPDDLEIEMNTKLQESITHLRVVFKDDIPVKTPSNVIPQVTSKLNSVSLLELECKLPNRGYR